MITLWLVREGQERGVAEVWQRCVSSGRGGRGSFFGGWEEVRGGGVDGRAVLGAVEIFFYYFYEKYKKCCIFVAYYLP